MLWWYDRMRLTKYRAYVTTMKARPEFVTADPAHEPLNAAVEMMGRLIDMIDHLRGEPS